MSDGLGDLRSTLQRRLLGQTTYAGVKAVKNPFDAWVYQEIVWERWPQYIVEVGNWAGGALLMYAHWLDAQGTRTAKVIGVDVDHSRVPAMVRQHPRIVLVTGDGQAAVAQVAALIPSGAETLVIEDSSHEYTQCLGVLRAYAGLVRSGGYMIVEDTICWHGLNEGPNPGPYEAVEVFLQENGGRWSRDLSRESFGVTWNPGGYLRRVSDGKG